MTPPIKHITTENSPPRKRATKKELQKRENFVIEFARKYHPVTVRQVFYAATVNGIIDKTEHGYHKIQQACLTARRDGRLDYRWIGDNSRGFYQVESYENIHDASNRFSSQYKKDFWAKSSIGVEVWLEKEALAGTLKPVTNEFRVRLVPTRGFASETILYEAVQHAHAEGREKLTVFTLYDFDASGQTAQATVGRRLSEMADDLFGLCVEHCPLALTLDQIIQMNLPTRPAKTKSKTDQKWPYDFAVELDAMPPEELRNIVHTQLETLMPTDIREMYLLAETQDRARIRMALSEF